MSNRKGTNWEEVLQDDELVSHEKTGKPVVLLRGLQRLAREAGYNGSSMWLNHVDVGKMGVFQCVYTAVFDDGTSWSGAGDCNAQNTNGDFLSFPTAVAESRAEARALKKALGITMLAAEELDLSAPVKPGGRIDPAVVRTIQTLLDRNGTDVATILRTVLPKERAEEAVELPALTVSEGQKILQYLNSPKSKRVSAKDAREKRKQELKQQVSGDEKTA